MKQTTMCLLSGFFGALFAVACGAVDGNNVVGKSAYADAGVGLSKTILGEGVCSDTDGDGMTEPIGTDDVAGLESPAAAMGYWFKNRQTGLWVDSMFGSLDCSEWKYIVID